MTPPPMAEIEIRPRTLLETKIVRFKRKFSTMANGNFLNAGVPALAEKMNASDVGDPDCSPAGISDPKNLIVANVVL